jgi:prevent-host-death family protein
LLKNVTEYQASGDSGCSKKTKRKTNGGNCMKTVTLRDAKQQLSEYVSKSQKDKILITKHGKPAAIVWGVEGKDFEDILYMTDPGFWKMIRTRRKSKSVPWAKKSERKL